MNSGMVIVTGAYGFIGSKFVKYLNSKGITDIIVSDYLTNGRSYKSLMGTKVSLCMSPDDLLEHLESIHKTGNKIERVYHLGAISDTDCWDGELMMNRNYHYSVSLIAQCVTLNIPVTYASSASVYGNGDGPLNLYAYTKYLVDEYVRAYCGIGQYQGFRFFNVYSNDDSEQYKRQPSPYYRFKQQALETGRIEIFEGSENFYRDFVHVDRVCEVMYNMANEGSTGIFDLGSGVKTSFYDVAHSIAAEHGATVVTIPFPEHLKGTYQTNTLADMSYLKDIND